MIVVALEKKSHLQSHKDPFCDLYVFNIFMWDLFTILEEIDFASCASDNTTFVSEAIPENVMKSVESRSATLLEWFLNNQMRDNVNKCKKLWRLSCPVQSKKLSKFFSQRVNKLLASISKYKITWILENAYHIFQSMSLQKHWYHHPTWTF